MPQSSIMRKKYAMGKEKKHKNGHMMTDKEMKAQKKGMKKGKMM